MDTEPLPIVRMERTEAHGAQRLAVYKLRRGAEGASQKVFWNTARQ